MPKMLFKIVFENRPHPNFLFSPKNNKKCNILFKCVVPYMWLKKTKKNKDLKLKRKRVFSKNFQVFFN